MDDFSFSFSFVSYDFSYSPPSYSFASYDTGGFNSVGGSGYAGQNVSYEGTTASGFDAFTSNPYVTNTTTTGYTQVESIVGTANYQIGVDYTNNAVSGFANPNTGGTQALSLDNTYYTIQTGSDAYLTSQFNAAGTIATIQTATATVIGSTLGVDNMFSDMSADTDTSTINTGENNTVFDPNADFTPPDTGYRVKIDGQGDLTVSAVDYEATIIDLFAELRNVIPATISQSVEGALTTTQEFQTGTTNVRVIGPGIDVFSGQAQTEIDVGGRTQSFYDRILEIAEAQAENDPAYAQLVRPSDFGFDLATSTFASDQDAELYGLALQQRVVDVITSGLNTVDQTLAVTQRLVALNPEFFATAKTNLETGVTYYTVNSLFDISMTLQEVTADPAALQAIRNLIDAAGGDVSNADLRSSTINAVTDVLGLAGVEIVDPAYNFTSNQNISVSQIGPNNLTGYFSSEATSAQLAELEVLRTQLDTEVNDIELTQPNSSSVAGVRLTIELGRQAQDLLDTNGAGLGLDAEQRAVLEAKANKGQSAAEYVASTVAEARNVIEQVSNISVTDSDQLTPQQARTQLTTSYLDQLTPLQREILAIAGLEGAVLNLRSGFGNGGNLFSPNDTTFPIVTPNTVDATGVVGGIINNRIANHIAQFGSISEEEAAAIEAAVYTMAAVINQETGLSDLVTNNGITAVSSDILNQARIAIDSPLVIKGAITDEVKAFLDVAPGDLVTNRLIEQAVNSVLSKIPGVNAIGALAGNARTLNQFATGLSQENISLGQLAFDALKLISPQIRVASSVISFLDRAISADIFSGVNANNPTILTQQQTSAIVEIIDLSSGGDAAATWFEENTTVTAAALLASEVFADGGGAGDDDVENTDSGVVVDDDVIESLGLPNPDSFTSETSTGLLTVPEDQFTETDGGLFVANEDLEISEDDILTEDDTTVTEDPYDTRGTPYDDDGNLNPGWAINPETGEPYYIGGDYIDPSTIAQATADFEAARIAALKTLANQQNAIGLQRKQANEGDWRVRLRLAPGADYLYKDPDIAADGILWPLNITDGVVFPYTPQINTTYGANYNSYDLTHSNYRGYFYQNSYVDEIQMSATFTAQDTNEANYLLAVIHFFKSVTKMFYGQDAQRGAPPPLVFLQGLGEFQFNLHPCVVKTFNYNLPADVDYIRARSVNINGTDLLQRRDRQTVSTNPLSGVIDRLRNAGLPLGALTSVPAPQTLGTNNPTYVPTKLDIQLGLLPIQTRQQVSKQFSVKSYANGDLLKGGFW